MAETERMKIALSIEVYEARKRNSFTKVLPWLAGVLIVGLCAALVITLSQSAGRKEGFLSQFYGELSAACGQAQSLLQNETQEELQNTALSLAALDTIMEDGRKFVDSDIFYNYQLGGFDSIARTLLFGLEYNGTVLCEGFWEDGKLSESERAYLAALVSDLNTLKEALSKNGGANTGMSIKKFNGYTHVLFSKYSDVLSLGLSDPDGE